MEFEAPVCVVTNTQCLTTNFSNATPRTFLCLVAGGVAKPLPEAKVEMGAHGEASFTASSGRKPNGAVNVCNWIGIWVKGFP